MATVKVVANLVNWLKRKRLGHQESAGKGGDGPRVTSCDLRTTCLRPSCDLRATRVHCFCVQIDCAAGSILCTLLQPNSG